MINSNDRYRELLTSTTKETYPKYVQDKLLKEMDKKDIVKLKKRRTAEGKENILDLTEIDEDERLSQGIQDRQEVIKYLEQSEFTKSYKYSVMFEVPNINAFSRLDI